MNPVLLKELRTRVRDGRSTALLCGYLSVISGIAVLVLLSMSERNPFGPSGQGTIAPEAGLTIYVTVAFLQLVLIAMVAPALTVGVVSGERERQTMDLLFVTGIGSLGIITGKLLASLAFALLLQVASLPVMALVLLFGGVSLKHLGLTFLIQFVTIMAFGATGILCSTLFRRTQVAVVTAYLLMALVVVGTPLIAGLAMDFPRPPIMTPQGPVAPPPPKAVYVIYANPILALGSALPQGGPNMEIMQSFRFAWNIIGNRMSYAPTMPSPRPGMPPAPGGQPQKPPQPPPAPWKVYVVICAAVIAGAVATAVTILHPVKPWQRFLVRRRLAKEAKAAGAEGVQAG